MSCVRYSFDVKRIFPSVFPISSFFVHGRDGQMREEYNSILTMVIRDSRFPIILHFTFTFSTLRVDICIVVRDCTGNVARDCC